MRRTTFQSGIVSIAIIAAAFLVWRSWDSGVPKSRGTRVAQRAAPYEVAPKPAQDDSERTVPIEKTLSSLPPDAFAPDDNPEDWDKFQSTERMQHLEERFSAALGAIARGDLPVEKHVFIAESALTSMRSELYSTTAGREKHRNYESKLEYLLSQK